MQRPPQQPRTTFLSDDTLKKLVRASNPAFKVLLFAFRETGARPSEVCNLNWTDVHADHWRLGKHKTYAKTGRPRVIVLSRRMQKLMPALQKRRSTSKFVFVDTRGEPWTTDAIQSQMKRLKAKLGIKDQVCAYLIRHSFATNAGSSR
jgi:integrase